MAQESVFLAFAHQDREAAARISEQLRRSDLRTWNATEIQPGDDFASAISAGLQAARAIVVLVTPNALDSVWVEREVEFARVSGTPTFPVLLDDGPPLPQLKAVQHARAQSDGTLPPETLDLLRAAVVRTRDTEASDVAAGVLRALDSRVLGSVVAELQERIVLLLGNFADAHYDRLLRLQAELSRRGMHPVIFDFKQSPQSDYGETVRILAGLASFVIADMTDPRSVVMELQLIAPDTAVPIVPVIARDQEPVALFADLLGKYDWVIEPVRYDSTENLARILDERVIEPAMSKRTALHERKRRSALAQVAGLAD